ncbi:hypothetical protein GGF31_000581 [Allomyces arbusculus]|nr:hypothetical protein GGF31_000581 [Allomyces arbusculus]
MSDAIRTLANKFGSNPRKFSSAKIPAADSSEDPRERFKALISEPKEFRHLAHSSNANEAAGVLSELWKTGEKLSRCQEDSRPTSLAESSVHAAQGSSPTTPSASRASKPFSTVTVEKTVATKIYFEAYFDRLMSTTTTGRNKRRLQLEADLEALNVAEDEKRTIRRQWLQKETEYIRSLRSRVTLNDFDLLKPLGRGAFGMIRLARDKNTGNLVALKTLDKATMLRRGQEGHVRAERDLLCQASDSCNFIVKLFYSFQDEHNLYLGLEYMPGGDLLSLLIKCDIFPEWMARFYAAEMLLAIEEAHSLGYVHRDIKADNLLISESGHLKLGDFGLSTDFHWTHDAEYYDAQRRMLETVRGRDGVTGTPLSGTGDALPADDDDNFTITPELFAAFKSQRRAQAFSIVGTTNYMAPEVLDGSGHDFKCDLWSFATILFEMLFGYPPFHHSSPSVTRQKILRCHYVFPAHAASVSPEARDLMAQLLVRDPATRPGLKEVMAHPWFRVPIDGQTVDWEAMRDGVVPPPWVPQLKNELDTSCFEDAAAVAGEGVGVPPGPPAAGEARMPGESDEALDLRKRMAFKGFTFKTFQP